MSTIAPLRFAAIAVTLAAGMSLAMWGGYEYRPLLFPERAAGPPAGSGESLLALQVFAKKRPMPALAFTDRDGHPLSLGNFRGRVVLLNLWATWCVPCRKEMPALDRLQQRLGGKDFTVLPLSIDQGGAPAVERFYRQLGLTRLGVYIASSAGVSASLALPGVPTSFLVDANGHEVARKIGPADWDSNDMMALIRRYLPPGRRQQAGP